MSITLTPVDQGYQFESDDCCGICHDDTAVHLMNHPNGGETHIFHAQCIDEWLKINPICPICSQKIIFPLKKRVITKLRNIAVKALNVIDENEGYGFLLVFISAVVFCEIWLKIAGELPQTTASRVWNKLKL